MRRIIPFVVIAGVVMILILAKGASPPEIQPAAAATAVYAPLSAAAPSEVSPEVIPVRVDLSPRGNTIVGSTNLPDGMVLSISINRPRRSDAAQRISVGLPACDPDCTPWTFTSTVKDGAFVAGPFKDMQSGSYSGEIMQMNQPPAVVRRIGENDEYLSGPLIKTLGGSGIRDIDFAFDMTLLPTSP